MAKVKIETESDWKALFPNLTPYWDASFIQRLQAAIVDETADNWPNGTDFYHEDYRWIKFMYGVTDRMGWSRRDVKKMNAHGQFWYDLSNLVDRLRSRLITMGRI
jgi:hypothetical protein